MLIGIDGYEANVTSRVGVGRFAFEVLKTLYFLDKKNSYDIFLPNKPLADLPKEREKWRYRTFASRGFWTLIGLPLAINLRRNKYSVFFSPTHYIPRFVKIARVVSIMDLSYLYFPQMFRKKDIYQLKNWTAYSIKNSQKIITISNFTKSEIIDYYHVPQDKVVVAYPGYDKTKFKIQNSKFKVNKVKDNYKINDDYVLFVGTLQPRKNIIRLIEAFNSLVKQFNNLTFKLVIVGKKGWIYEDIFKKITDLKLDKRIIFLDFVKEEDMPYLYSGAKALVLPSLYEGFGLPVIEAMACGTPTVVSDISSLPEVAKDATIYIDPHSVKSIKNGMERILVMKKQDKDLLIQKGLENVKRFDWTECSQIILKTLEEVGRL